MISKRKGNFLVLAPMLGNMYLLIKVQKKNFPRRVVGSQVNDPTYKIRTDILNLIAQNGQSYVEIFYDLKQFLGSLNASKYDVQASFKIIALYLSISIPKASECVWKRLLNDTSLSQCTD